jgi:DNA invertase Pin-like site-specific DNA recombinase
MAMRYVLYLRVSSNQQVRDGQGLEIQEAAGRRWLRQGRHRLVEVCIDAAFSGGDDVGERPGLARALALVGGDRADGILVPVLDRLARDMILQEQILAELHRMGKELRSCSPAEDANLDNDPDDPQRAFIRRVLGAHAQYERDVIRLRLRAGRQRKLMLGGYAGGAPPYGWAAVRGELVKVPGEQLAIRSIRKMREEHEMSYRAIAARLEEMGVPSRAKHAQWRAATVRDIYLRANLRRPPAKNAALPSPDLAEVTA